MKFMYKKAILTVMAAVFCLCNAHAIEEANLVIADATAEAGSTVTIPVTMTGRASGYQFAVYPPAGITLTKVQRGEVIKVRDDDDEYVFTFKNAERDNGGRFVLCYSIGVRTEEPGEVAMLVFTVDKDLAPGTYEIVMNDAECAHAADILSTYSERTSTITVTNATAVSAVSVDNFTGAVEVYNAAGLKVKTMERGGAVADITADLASGTYVLKGNGSAVKIVKE